MTVTSAGDAALLVELEPRIDASVNAQAIAIADHLRREAVEGVRDVVSTFRSVAVHFDPLRIDREALHRAIEAAVRARVVERPGRRIDVPTVYGGPDGPDLAEVARYAGLSETEVIRRHANVDYRVFMLGFVPGFAYMGVVDSAIAAPRRSTPRLRVPAGSVGIAGVQTGIYPRETPGGWQLVGRTDLELFDASETRPPLLAPGDTVRFRPVAPSTRGASRYGSPARTMTVRATGTSIHGKRTITVISPGLLTTVQDLGRWGHQHDGVSVSGAMDVPAHRVANRCVGNPENEATLEVTIAGPELRFEAPATIAVSGADLEPTIDGAAVRLGAGIPVRAGATLRFGQRRAGARAYVAFDGGIAVPPVLGSRATHVPTEMGGLSGRLLRTGDRIPLGDRRDHATTLVSDPPRPAVGAVALRVVPGPQAEFFDERSFGALTRSTFTVSPQSNRMAYRLTSTMAIPCASQRVMISDAAFIGGIQVTPSGDAILLMSDRQTIGGYPQIATVISADLPVAGQLAPGDAFGFVPCTTSAALAALIAQEGHLRALH